MLILATILVILLLGTAAIAVITFMRAIAWNGMTKYGWSNTTDEEL